MRIDGGPVKIGRASNVDKRLSQVQCGCPQTIDQVISFPHRGHEEREWHAHFASQRIRGEWFEWTPGLEEAIKRAGRGLSWKRLTVPDEAVNDLYERTFGISYTDLKKLPRPTAESCARTNAEIARLKSPKPSQEDPE